MSTRTSKNGDTAKPEAAGDEEVTAQKAMVEENGNEDEMLVEEENGEPPVERGEGEDSGEAVEEATDVKMAETQESEDAVAA